jgi:hypothetical protein
MIDPESTSFNRLTVAVVSALSSSADEQILAQEQSVICRPIGIKSEIEAAFDVSGKETEGTLILTQTRLLYVHGAEQSEQLRTGLASAKKIYYSDVEDLSFIPSDPANLTIWLSAVTKLVGHKTRGMSPKLEVVWESGGMKRSVEFVQQLTGASRKKNLNDWAAVIEHLKSGALKVSPLAKAPDKTTLEGKILQALGDMQEKGVMTIETELEKTYNTQLDTDDVEAACGRLVEQGLIVNISPAGDLPFYEKASPLGKDSLDAD